MMMMMMVMMMMMMVVMMMMMMPLFLRHCQLLVSHGLAQLHPGLLGLGLGRAHLAFGPRRGARELFLRLRQLHLDRPHLGAAAVDELLHLLDPPRELRAEPARSLGRPPPGVGDGQGLGPRFQGHRDHTVVAALPLLYPAVRAAYDVLVLVHGARGQLQVAAPEPALAPLHAGGAGGVPAPKA